MLSKVINRLKNSYLVYHFEVSFKNVSYCTKILDILWEENLIRGYKVTNNNFVTVFLKYYNGSPVCNKMVVISKRRDRIYLSSLDLSRVINTFGVLIVSTSKGIMTAEKAIGNGEGGEILAYVS